MAKRKTFEVEALRKKINDMILHSSDDLSGGRIAVSEILNSVLHETGNYNGFRFLSADDMKNSMLGESLGIRGTFDDDIVERFRDTDSTRIAYF